MLKTMKLLSWNCQGSKRKEKHNYIVDLCNKFKFNVAFIMETRANYSSSSERLNLLPLPRRFIVLVFGLKGGLWLAWSMDINLKILDYSQHHVHTEISTLNGSYCFKDFFIHAPITTKQRSNFWNKLALYTIVITLKLSLEIFNEYTYSLGKWGKPQKSLKSRRELIALVNDKKFSDLRGIGSV